MEHQEAWQIVGLDIWSGCRYIIEPLAWIVFGYLFAGEVYENTNYNILGMVFVFALLITYWSYQ